MDLDENILGWRAKARLGTTLRDKWRLERLLGVGGMAAVYEATHRNGMRAAVKVLHGELAGNEEARTRFVQEGYLANKVGHPAAVQALDDDVAEDGATFLVLELLEGNTLEAIAAALPNRRLGLSEVMAVGDAVLDLLAAAHAAGIVHRDLKPENVFITREGQVKVLDFGLARHHESGRLTRTGTGMGTPAFLPPEQANGQWDRVDGRTDLWALGATLFTLATGRLVHDEKSLNRLLVAVMTKPAPPLRLVLPEASEAAAYAIDKALAFEPADRFESAREMQAAVRAARAELSPPHLGGLVGATVASEGGRTLLGSTHTYRPRSPTRARNLILAAAGALAIAATLVYFATSPGHSSPDPSSTNPASPDPSVPGHSSMGPAPAAPIAEPESPEGQGPLPSPGESLEPAERDESRSSQEEDRGPEEKTAPKPGPPIRPPPPPAPEPPPARSADPFGEFR